ncbi:Protein GrpE [bioreactor metagenome]|uniref:Protein GrpE n=1 Tax=bioreactor metagenome TaxID=1076179 RepID=A0A644T611_9ZZZZ|nr:nucleotide exchange factor GrpE [Candidatus Elulimicrobiales bacterium]
MKDKKDKKTSENEENEDIVFEELNEDGEEMTEKQKNKNEKEKLKEKFEDKIERLEKERDEYLRGWQRVQADYKNRENELEDYKKNIIKFANENLVKEMLPVFDGYDAARSNKQQWEDVNPNWRIGVEYLFSQFLDILADAGVVIYGEEGEEYDPTFHEAIELIELPDEDKNKNHKIISVVQKGYKMGDKILRAAKVKVGKLKD